MIKSLSLRIITGLWALALLVPMQRLQPFRWEVFGIHLPVYYFIITLPTAAVMLGLWVKYRPQTVWQWAWWIFPAICLPGILMGADSLWGFRQWVSLWMRGLGVGAVLACLPISGAAARGVFRWIYPIVIGVCFFGLGEKLFDANPLTDNFVERSISLVNAGNQVSNLFYRQPSNYAGSQRPMGTQGNRIPFLICLVPFFPIALWKLTEAPRKTVWVHAIAAGALFALTLWAHVLTGWVGFMTGLAAYAWLRIEKEKKAVLRLLLVCAGLLLLSLLIPPLRSSFISGVKHFSFQNRDIHHRLGSLPTLRALKGHVLFGVGYGNYSKVYKPYYKGPIIDDESPDNQFLLWLIENGVVGFLGLLVFLWGLAHSCWKRLASLSSREDQAFYQALLAAWIASLCTLPFFDNFYWMGPTMTFWCLLGLLSSCLQLERIAGRHAL